MDGKEVSQLDFKWSLRSFFCVCFTRVRNFVAKPMRVWTSFKFKSFLSFLLNCKCMRGRCVAVAIRIPSLTICLYPSINDGSLNTVNQQLWLKRRKEESRAWDGVWQGHLYYKMMRNWRMRMKVKVRGSLLFHYYNLCYYDRSSNSNHSRIMTAGSFLHYKVRNYSFN